MDFIRYACGDFWHFVAVVILIATFGSWGSLLLMAAKGLFGKGRRHG